MKRLIILIIGLSLQSCNPITDLKEAHEIKNYYCTLEQSDRVSKEMMYCKMNTHDFFSNHCYVEAIKRNCIKGD
jgi:hypothetical protein